MILSPRDEQQLRNGVIKIRFCRFLDLIELGEVKMHKDILDEFRHKPVSVTIRSKKSPMEGRETYEHAICRGVIPKQYGLGETSLHPLGKSRNTTKHQASG